MDLEKKTNSITKFECEGPGIKVEVSDISFNYPGRILEVISNISFTIKASEKVCLVGQNSSGKASLLNVISTLYTPCSGALRFNEYHALDLDLEELRSFVGSYLESEELFEGTLYENISLMRKSVKPEDVIWAIDNLGLNDFVNSSKEGLHCMLKPTGKSLSKSVAQKILLARSIVIRPKLLIIGNNLNNLSSLDKHAVVDFLCDESNLWTLVCSSNDAYFAAKCNKVIYLKEGKVEENGTFNSLIKNKEVKNILDA